jgi:hypothetical protein
MQNNVGIFHLDMESLELITIRRHMDYTNVYEKSEFQLNVGFLNGASPSGSTSIEFIHPWHSLLHCDYEVSQLIYCFGSYCRLKLPLINCFCDVCKEAYLSSSTLVASSHYIIIF